MSAINPSADEQLVVDLLFQHQGDIEAIDSFKKMQERLEAITMMFHDIAAAAGVSYDVMISGAIKYQEILSQSLNLGNVTGLPINKQALTQVAASPEALAAETAAINARTTAANAKAASEEKATAALVQQQQYQDYLLKGAAEQKVADEARVQALLLQNQEYQQYLITSKAVAQAEAEAKKIAGLAQNQQYQEYDAAGKAAAKADAEAKAAAALAQQQQYQEYILKGAEQQKIDDEARVQALLAQNQQYQEYIALGKTEAAQQAIQQKRDMELYELEGKRNAQRVQLADINMDEVKNEDILYDKRQKALKLNIQTEESWARIKDQAIAIGNMPNPADQIKPMAALINGEVNNGLKDTTGLVQKIKTETGMLPATLQKTGKEVENIRNGLWGMAKEAFSLGAIMNTLFGVGMAMLVFQLTQLITNFFTGMITQVNTLQNSITSMAAAEKTMSLAGVEVTGKDMLDIVAHLEKIWTNISHTDLMDATGSLALRLADKGISPQQLEQILQFAISRKVLMPMKTLSEIMTTTISSILSNNYEGVNTLGASISEKAIVAKAKELGIIKDINKELSDREKMDIKIALLNDTVNSTLEEVVAKQDDLANASSKLSANFSNLIGTNAQGFVDGWNAFLLVLNDIVTASQSIKDNLAKVYEDSAKNNEKLVKDWGTFGTVLKWITGGIAVGFAALAAALFPEIVLPIAGAVAALVVIYNTIKSKMPADKKPMSEEDLGKKNTPTYTPILRPEDAAATEEAAKKIKAWLQDVQNAMDSFADKAEKMQQDFENTMVRMADAARLAYERALKDGEISRKKIVDDYNRRIADAEESYRANQINDEERYQEKLRQLREQYLMNLEDALHERDARQVLRLAREYAMNKTNAQRDYELTRKEAERQHKIEMERLRAEQAERLRQFDEEQALKLARMEEDEKIKEAQAAQNYEIEKARLEAEKKDRLEQLKQSLVDQLGLDEQGAKAIQELLASYFDQNGSIDLMMQFTYNNTTRLMAELMKNLMDFYAKYKAVIQDIANMGPHGGQDKWWEEKQPTSPTGPTNQMSPLGATNLPRNFYPTSGGRGRSPLGSTSMELMVTLSPDLEARIVNRTLEDMSNIIMQVRKARA